MTVEGRVRYLDSAAKVLSESIRRRLLCRCDQKEQHQKVCLVCDAAQFVEVARSRLRGVAMLAEVYSNQP